MVPVKPGNKLGGEKGEIVALGAEISALNGAQGEVGVSLKKCFFTIFINQPVFAKTAGLSDKTARFQKCPANFVSLPDSMSDEKLIQKNAQTVF